MPDAFNHPASSPTPQRRLRRVGLTWVGVWAVSACLLVATTQRGVAWQDSGVFQLRVMRGDLTGEKGLALAHPLLIVLGRGMTHLVGWGGPAWRINLLSALAGAVAAANLAWLVLRVAPGRRGAAWLAAGAFVLAHTVWWLGTVCESHALLAALFTGELHALLWLTRRGGYRAALCLGLLSGLAFSTHNLALLALPAYALCVAVLCAGGRLGRGAMAWFAAGWLAGAALFLTLIARAAATDGLGQAVASALFGRSWQGPVLGFSARAMARGGAYVLYNFPNAALPLAAMGLWALGRMAPGALAWTVRYLLAVHLVFALRYAVADQFMFFVPAYATIAMLSGLGLAWLCSQGRRGWLPAAALATLVLGPGIYAAAPWACRQAGVSAPGRADLPFRDPYAYWLQPWKAGENSAEQFAAEALDSVPRGSKVVSDGTALPPLEWAMQFRGAGGGRTALLVRCHTREDRRARERVRGLRDEGVRSRVDRTIGQTHPPSRAVLFRAEWKDREE